MIHRRLAALLLVALPAFALDEFQPAEEGVIAVDLQNGLDWGIGDFDPDGALQEPFGSPLTWSPGVQVRLGLPNLTEISLEVPLAVLNKDALGAKEGDWGFDQSRLGFKLGIEDWPVAVVGAVSFPLGHTVIVGDEPRWRFLAGGIGHWERKKFHLDGSVTWTVTPANEDGIRPGDVWEIVVRPQYHLNTVFTPYLGGVATITTAGKVNEIRDGQMSRLVTLQPGTFVTLGEEWNLVFQAPVTVAGDWPETATAGLYLGITYTMAP